MALINISLSAYITGKLRKAVIDGDLIDYNLSGRSSQFGNFIYPDEPKISKLMQNKNNFPRISIQSVNQNSDHRLGQMSDSYLMKETLKITCYTVRDLICTIKNTSDESITYNGLLGDTYELTNLPFSSISMVTGTLMGSSHTFINETDYEKYDNDQDGFFDSIKWLSGDTPDNGTNFLVSYNRKGAGIEIVRIIAQNINEYFRKNWRTQWTENKAFNYNLISSSPVTFEENLGLYRWEIVVQFSLFNGTETV